MVESYERTTIGGFCAFAMAANSRADFARALRDKMVLEISAIAPDREGDLAARPHRTNEMNWSSTVL
ncbi:MAG: hypothetical protein ACREEP_02965 [Dongiaceae bacterium]